MVRAGNPPSGNPLSRQGSQRQSGRMQVGAPPPPPLPPMPSPGHVRHLSAERFQGRDIMNPAETTHVSIKADALCHQIYAWCQVIPLAGQLRETFPYVTHNLEGKLSCRVPLFNWWQTQVMASNKV